MFQFLRKSDRCMEWNLCKNKNYVVNIVVVDKLLTHDNNC